MATDPTERVIVTTDGNQTLSVVERLKRQMSDNPKDFPTLKAAHLMGGEAPEAADTQVATQIDLILPRRLRAKAVGGALFKFLLGNPVLLYDVYLLGRQGFVHLLKETMRSDSLAAGLSDLELEVSWEIYELNVRELAAKGARWRKRKDWRG